MKWILHGGEDYVLLATVSPKNLQELLRSAEKEGISITPIGATNDTGRMEFIHSDGSKSELIAGGWNHFR